MSVTQEAIKDAVGNRRLGDDIVPFGNRQLRSDNDSLFAIAVFEYLEQGDPGDGIK